MSKQLTAEEFDHDGKFDNHWTAPILWDENAQTVHQGEPGDGAHHHWFYRVEQDDPEFAEYLQNLYDNNFVDGGYIADDGSFYMINNTPIPEHLHPVWKDEWPKLSTTIQRTPLAPQKKEELFAGRNPFIYHAPSDTLYLGQGTHEGVAYYMPDDIRDEWEDTRHRSTDEFINGAYDKMGGQAAYYVSSGQPTEWLDLSEPANEQGYPEFEQVHRALQNYHAQRTSSNIDDVVEQVQSVLTPDLLHRDYQDNPKAHCYAASEAIYHLLGGAASGLKPVRMRLDNGTTHWWLQDADGNIIDPTHDQFDTPVDYTLGRGGGFLTREPSKRAQEIINRVRNRTAAADNIIELDGNRDQGWRKFFYAPDTDTLYWWEVDGMDGNPTHSAQQYGQGYSSADYNDQPCGFISPTDDVHYYEWGNEEQNERCRQLVNEMLHRHTKTAAEPFNYNSVDWKKLKIDIVALASQYGVQIRWDSSLRLDEAIGYPDHQVIYLPSRMDNDLAYAIALHEIGHFAFAQEYDRLDHDYPGSLSTHEEEYWVDHWMLEHAEIPISQSALAQLKMYLDEYEHNAPTPEPGYGWITQSAVDDYKFFYDTQTDELHIWPVDPQTGDPHHHEYAFYNFNFERLDDEDDAWDTSRYIQGWLFRDDGWNLATEGQWSDKGYYEHSEEEENKAKQAVRQWMQQHGITGEVHESAVTADYNQLTPEQIEALQHSEFEQERGRQKAEQYFTDPNNRISKIARTTKTSTRTYRWVYNPDTDQVYFNSDFPAYDDLNHGELAYIAGIRRLEYGGYVGYNGDPNYISTHPFYEKPTKHIMNRVRDELAQRRFQLTNEEAGQLSTEGASTLDQGINTPQIQPLGGHVYESNRGGNNPKTPPNPRTHCPSGIQHALSIVRPIFVNSCINSTGNLALPNRYAAIHLLGSPELIGRDKYIRTMPVTLPATPNTTTNITKPPRGKYTVRAKYPHQASTLGYPRNETEEHLFANETISSFSGYRVEQATRWLYSPESGLVTWNDGDTHTQKAYKLGVENYVGGDIYVPFLDEESSSVSMDHDTPYEYITPAYQALRGLGIPPEGFKPVYGWHEFQHLLKDSSHWTFAGKNDKTVSTYDLDQPPRVQWLGGDGDFIKFIYKPEENVLYVWNTDALDGTPWHSHQEYKYNISYLTDQMNGYIEPGEYPQFYSSNIEGTDSYQTWYSVRKEMPGLASVLGQLIAGKRISQYDQYDILPDAYNLQDVRDIHEYAIPFVWDKGTVYTGSPESGHMGIAYEHQMSVDMDGYDSTGEYRHDFYDDIPGEWYTGRVWPKQGIVLGWNNEIPEQVKQDVLNEVGGRTSRESREYREYSTPGDSLPIRWVYVPGKGFNFGWDAEDEHHELAWHQGARDDNWYGGWFYSNGEPTLDYTPGDWMRDEPMLYEHYPQMRDELMAELARPKKEIESHKKEAAISTIQLPGLGNGADGKWIYDSKGQYLYWWFVDGQDGMPAHHWQTYENKVPDAFDDNNFAGHFTHVGDKAFVTLIVAPNNLLPEPPNLSDQDAYDQWWDKREELQEQYRPIIEEALTEAMKNAQDLEWTSDTLKPRTAASYAKWIYHIPTGQTEIWRADEGTHDRTAYQLGWGPDDYIAGRFFPQANYVEIFPQYGHRDIWPLAEDQLRQDLGRPKTSSMPNWFRWIYDFDNDEVHLWNGLEHDHDEYAYNTPSLRGFDKQWDGGAINADGTDFELYHYNHDNPISLDDLYLKVVNAIKEEYGDLKTSAVTLTPLDPPRVTWVDPSVVPHDVPYELDKVPFYKFIYDPVNHEVKIWQTDKYEWPHHTQMKYVYGPHTFGNWIGQYDAVDNSISGHGEGYDNDTFAREILPTIQNAVEMNKTADNENAFGSADEIHWFENFIYDPITKEVHYSTDDHETMMYNIYRWDHQTSEVVGWIFEDNSKPAQYYAVFDSVSYGDENSRYHADALKALQEKYPGITEIPTESWMGLHQIDEVNKTFNMYGANYPVEIHDIPEEASPNELPGLTRRYPIIHNIPSNEVFIGPYDQHHSPTKYKYNLYDTNEGFLYPERVYPEFPANVVHWFDPVPNDVKDAVEKHFGAEGSRVWNGMSYEDF